MTFPQTSVKHNPVKPLPDAPCDAERGGRGFAQSQAL